MNREIRVDVLGAGREVGRNCFKLTYPTGEKILLDCGVNADHGDGSKYPLNVKKLKTIDLAFASHPHLDHIGAFPLACMNGLKSPIVIADEIARQVSRVILQDAYKLENGKAEYELRWIEYALCRMRIIKAGRCGSVSYELIPTSHIPGGVGILLKHPQTKSVLYVGDVKTSETRLMKTRTDFPQADVIFVEATYGNASHPDRKKTEEEFEENVLETLARGGRVVIPCFAEARTQEILLLLYLMREKIVVPVYLDGMGRSITQIYLENAEKIDNPELVEAVKWVKLVENNDERVNSLNHQAIIIPSGGMLNSPLARHYLKKIAGDRKSMLMLTGFQAKNTGGYELAHTGAITFNLGTPNEYLLKPSCQVVHLSFSSHDDAQKLKDLIEIVNSETVIGIHGEEDGLAGLEYITRSFEKVRYIAPKNGDIIRI